jgi:hypothetical protein
MSVDWMHALAESISVHFPHFRQQSYFEECFTHEVEERHAAEALEVTQMVLRERPQLLNPTLEKWVIPFSTAKLYAVAQS